MPPPLSPPLPLPLHYPCTRMCNSSLLPAHTTAPIRACMAPNCRKRTAPYYCQHALSYSSMQYVSGLVPVSASGCFCSCVQFLLLTMPYVAAHGCGPVLLPLCTAPRYQGS